jgi:hypothetical protein
MGTGVIEGACGHLVNDRLEPSGMRWTTGGAQAVLDLQAVRLNGHGETSGPFHRHHQHQRWYGQSAPAPALAETRALEWAACSVGYPRFLVTLKLLTHEIPQDSYQTHYASRFSRSGILRRTSL